MAIPIYVISELLFPLISQKLVLNVNIIQVLEQKHGTT